ncbi:kaptin [Acrasis kona]|uniref:Kaptin n=1 Tax=Acrasis kona TaxID=1008807 RepID=A0AAW2ZGF6_9EUKA
MYLPTNKYSLCVLDDIKDHNNTIPPSQRHNFVFLATTNNVYCIQPQFDDATAISMQEIPIYTIARIPADTEIVSMTAFRHNEEKIVLAIAITIAEERPSRGYLYLFIFTEDELIMKRVLRQPQDNLLRSFPLRYVPMQLLRKRVELQGSISNILLLSGLDKSVHCFATVPPEQGYNVPQIQFMELDSYEYMKDLFPSLLHLPASALCIDIFETETHQITAIGCQNGFLRLTVLSKSRQGEVLENAPLFMNGPVNSLRLFRVRSQCEDINNPTACHPFVGNLLKQMTGCDVDSKTKSTELSDDVDLGYNILQCLNLVVGEAMGRVTLFRNVEQNLLEDAIVLVPEVIKKDSTPFSFTSTPPYNLSRRSSVTSNSSIPPSPSSLTQTRQDSVLCVNYFDIDADGLNEILIGTYSKKMLVFKMNTYNNQYELAEIYKYPSPVYCIEPVDINCDGVVELVVSSMHNLHIMQPDLEEMQKKVIDRLTTMMDFLFPK